MPACDTFKDDFFWMLREGKGYFAWIHGQPYRLARHLRFGHRGHCPLCDDRAPAPREMVRAVTEEQVCENPLFDLVLKALIRAEIRLISRFVPQRSHEERLTGSLVSEIDSAVFLMRTEFRKTCLQLYSVEKDVDFFYYDLSRGGKLEKTTGADLGFIMVIDLPDFPYAVKSLILQAKKVDANSAKIERPQYQTLSGHGAAGCAYLLYDMDLPRRCSPLVVGIERYELKKQYEECVKHNSQSFSYPFDKARSDGHPLSLFLTSHFAYDDPVGLRHGSFKEALAMFSQLGERRLRTADAAVAEFNGRIAILSIGRTIRFGTPGNETMEIDV
ncbi:MAG: hypothetical protein AB1714_01580 [Acidobacteriota bacterium]